MSLELSKENSVLRQTSYPLWLAVNHHKTHNAKNLRFNRFSYLIDIYKDDSDYMVAMKSTQCGLSEYLIVRTIASSSDGRNVFYVLPSYDLVGRFVSNRVNRAIALVPYYQDLIKKSDVAMSSGALLKHIGKGAISFVGSHSAAPFTEFPADDLIVDELDQCNEQNLHMAVERLSASEHKKICKISNPTFSNRSIHYEYLKSDQKIWYIRCSSCGKWIQPDFFTHVIKQVDDAVYVLRDENYSPKTNCDIQAVCEHCNKPFDRFVDGIWAKRVKSDISGYHINKMFSTNVTIKDLVDRFNDGIVNEFAMQRFYNGDLGLPFITKGAMISSQMLDDCIGEHGTISEAGKGETCIMGIDVGRFLHVVIGRINGEGRTELVHAGEYRDEMDIMDLYRKFNVRMGVIDAMPETRLSRKIIYNCKGMFMAYYGSSKSENVNPIDKIISSDRTESLDSVKEAIIIKTLILPKNIRAIPDFYDHMTASTRVYDEKEDRYSWEEGNAPDHYFHAMNYMMMARRLAIAVRH